MPASTSVNNIMPINNLHVNNFMGSSWKGPQMVPDGYSLINHMNNKVQQLRIFL